MAVPRSFPPSIVVQVKALACELPHRLGLPLSRMSLADIRQEVTAQGIVAQVSGTTLWRWLSADALRPWQHRSWSFPVIRISLSKQDASSIFMPGSGKENAYKTLSSSSPQTKRPAFKRDAVSNPLCRLLPAARCG